MTSKRKPEPEPMVGGVEKLRRLVEADPELWVFTLADVAKVYGMSQRTLERHAAAGELNAKRVGRDLCITIAELKSCLARKGDGQED